MPEGLAHVSIAVAPTIAGALPPPPSRPIFRARLLRLPRRLIFICILDLACIAVAMVVNSPALQPQPAKTQIWPMIPMLINRTLEIFCFLFGHAFPLFSLMQMPLSLMALGVFIKMSECSSVHPTPPLPASAAVAATVSVAGPRPFCSAPIILAAVLMVIEIVIFLLVLFITQTHREHQIMLLTHRIMEADVEAGRGLRDHAHVQPLGPIMQGNSIKYCTVVQPCGQAIMVAVPEQLPAPPFIAAEPSPSSLQIPRAYPPTALQLSLLDSERHLAAAARSEGREAGSGDMIAGSPAATAISPAPEAAADGLSARSRRVIRINVDASSSCLGMAAALAHWTVSPNSRLSMPFGVHVDRSPVQALQEAGATAEAAAAPAQASIGKDASRNVVDVEGAENDTAAGEVAAEGASEEGMPLVGDGLDSSEDRCDEDVSRHGEYAASL